MENDLEKISNYLKQKKGKSVSEISKELKIEEYQVYGAVEYLKNQGQLIDIVDGELVKLDKPIRKNDIYEVPCNMKHLKMLLISDTHLCSNYDRLDILRHLYKEAEERDTDVILHSGDVVDGRSNRPQHIYELKETSYEGQIDYVVKNYPHTSIPTYMISGN